MKNNILLTSLLFLGWASSHAQGSFQPNRLGQAGASELLMNTTAKGSGFNGINIGSSDGIESTNVNPAGLATTKGTELVFAHTRWLIGSGISVNMVGFSQALGEEGTGGVIGVTVNSVRNGDLIRTTTDQPDGDIGTFTPNVSNFGISYAKKFTDHILVGATIRMISHSTPDVNAFGACFDAGVQYRALDNDKLKLGIALRNIGPSMRFSGQGLEYRAPITTDNPYSNSITIPTDKFELPSTLSLGLSYDAFNNEDNRVTALGGFLSNSFYFNQLGLGLEYGYKNYLALRASYLYEQGITGELGVKRFSAYTGPAFGGTLSLPFRSSKKSETMSLLGLDVSYRMSNPFKGTVAFGVRLDL